MEILEISTESQRTIDAALITAALRHYQTGIAPIATAKITADLNRIILEYDRIAKIPQHIDDNGVLILAGPDNADALKVTSLNTITVE